MSEKPYYTEHAGVAALLIVRGHKVLDVRPNPDNPRRFICVFPGEARADALEYFQGATVEAKTHQDATLAVLQMFREARNG